MLFYWSSPEEDLAFFLDGNSNKHFAQPRAPDGSCVRRLPHLAGESKLPQDSSGTDALASNPDELRRGGMIMPLDGHFAFQLVSPRRGPSIPRASAW